MPSFKPSLNMFYNLTPNIKYVVADFSSIEGTSYWYIIVFGNFKSNVRLFKSISVLYRINRVMVHRYSENRINFLKFGFFLLLTLWSTSENYLRKVCFQHFENHHAHDALKAGWWHWGSISFFIAPPPYFDF